MEQILYWALFAALLGPCIAGLWGYRHMNAARFSHLPPSITNLMVFPWASRAFWGCLGFLVFGLVFAIISGTQLGHGHVVGNGLSALGAIAIGYVCSGTRFRIELEPDGIRYGGLVRHTFVYWNDVSAVTWSGLTSSFGLKVADGQHIRISAGLTNLPEFARMTLANVPVTGIDGQARYWLMESSRGRPPSAKGETKSHQRFSPDREDDGD